MNLLSLLRLRKPTQPNPSSSQPEPSAEKFYGLDHALLNIPLPPPSMWMNLGYWKDTNDFPTACAALLDQVLITAGLLDANGGPIGVEEGKRLHLVDVGIGCGDQSARVLGYMRDKVVEEKGIEDGEGKKAPLFHSYVGITSLPVQARLAKSRVEDLQQDSKQQRQRAQIFCANAADPASWSSELKSSLPLPVNTTSGTSTSTSEASSEPEPKTKNETWLLALDTLYHFIPSRLPLFTYTHSTLHASISTFDLLLPTPKPPLLQRLILRLLCLLTGTPYSNFLSEEEYTSLIIAAGYEKEKIIFRDISEHVFPGIAGFMKRQAERWKMYGLEKGMGKFKGAGRIFGWWGRTGIVRGMVVVARV
ncbi:uncharacterized protein BDV17DRAFT_290555 [Aspergillus undulatus]|uniref:uncharacterized protein n=1 Tax=Aspergillus undulatus TaxID=1810928 RepID=UPI003CCDB811